LRVRVIWIKMNLYRSRVLLKSLDPFISPTNYARASSVSFRLFTSEQKGNNGSWPAKDARKNGTGANKKSKHLKRAEIADFARHIGYQPEELPSLLTAFTTKSFVQKFTSPETNYQYNDRLSTLGRTVQLMYVQEHLYTVYPNLLSDELEDLSSAITANEYLCKHLDIINIIRSPVKIIDLPSPARDSTLSDVALAIVGALYCDKGAEAARKFVEQFIIPVLDEVDINVLIKLEHPKQMLCYILTEQNKPLPVSRLLENTHIKGKDGAKDHANFVVGVFSGDELLAEHTSSLLAEAEKVAIVTALTKHFMTELKKVPNPSLHDNYQSEDMINIFETESSSKDLMSKTFT